MGHALKKNLEPERRGVFVGVLITSIQTIRIAFSYFPVFMSYASHMYNMM